MTTKNEIFTRFRFRRIAAFAVDTVIVSILFSIIYKIYGFPNFPGVLIKMLEVKKTVDNAANQEAVVEVMALFNEAFLQSLFIWFCYDVLSTLLFRGSTIGKLIFRLKVIHLNNDKGKFAYVLLLIVRSFSKFLLMFIFQGIPFLISAISMFASPQSLAGHDRLARLVVVNKNAA